MKNGKVVMRNNRYIALPDNNSRTAVITVSDEADVLARYEYEVRNLPAPQPYLSYSHNGKNTLYKGDVPLGKSHLLGMNELVAQANEGPQVKYKVVSFETVFIEAGSNKVITLKTKVTNSPASRRNPSNSYRQVINSTSHPLSCPADKDR